MLYKWPSINNSNPLTWKCKIFGCNDDSLPLIFNEQGERHGIKGFSFATATATIIKYTFHGCSWCKNYSKSPVEENEIWPKWLCDCAVCNASIAQKKSGLL